MLRSAAATAERQLSASILELSAKVGYPSQMALARLLGVTPQYVCDMLKGRRRWGAERLDELAGKLNLPPSQITRWHRLGAQADGWRV